jgi:hypothetical protein
MPCYALNTMTHTFTNRVIFKRNCSMLATALWIAGTVAMFLFNKGSKWLWLSDFLLICGFWPLLYYCRPSWPWLIFGVTNIVIAVEIAMLAVLPTNALPLSMRSIRQHITEHHCLGPWLWLGLASIFYGTIRAIKNTFLWLKTRT